MLATLFASAAHAQGATSDGSAAASFVPIILIFVVFYLLLIRPQSLRIKQHDAMVKALKRNDRVITGGGIIGKITKANGQENTVEVEIAKDVIVQITRTSISEIISGSAKPANDDKTKALPAKKNRTVAKSKK